ncbi:hypothetical protein [Pleurocapsa sp. FMAR1]|uniref:hypothetical protein n=1 Tax=Pleurocapsa sp. FMAR1 TaxID=3040204 RepID=UPI0029C9A396|nr:hypothetical protein [Pleurocapsa sp. FMAR1]
MVSNKRLSIYHTFGRQKPDKISNLSNFANLQCLCWWLYSGKYRYGNFQDQEMNFEQKLDILGAIAFHFDDTSA